MEIIQRLLDPKGLKEALANPEARWDRVEENKARRHGIETRIKGIKGIKGKACWTNVWKNLGVGVQKLKGAWLT